MFIQIRFIGGIPCMDVKLNVVNLNKQGKLYNQGMAPVYKTIPDPNRWERVRERLSFDVSVFNFYMSCIDQFCSFAIFIFCLKAYII